MKLWDKLLGHFYVIISVIIAGSTLLMWWPVVTRADNFKMFLFSLACSFLVVLGYMVDLYADRIMKQEIKIKNQQDYIDQFVPNLAEIEKVRHKCEVMEIENKSFSGRIKQEMEMRR